MIQFSNPREMLEVAVFHAEAGLRAIEADWQRLLARLKRRRFYHAVEWYRSYLAAFDDKLTPLSFYVVRRGDEPLAIVPLVHQRRRRFGLPVRKIAFPQHWHLPLGDILCDPELPADVLLRNLTRVFHEEGRRWDLLVFTDVMEESILNALRTGRYPRTLFWPAKSCDAVACDRPYDEITRSFSKNFRSNLSKARNKLAKESAVEFTSTTDGEELRRCFAEFLEIEASGWKGQNGAGSAIKLHPDLMRFYESLISEFEPSRRVVLNCLRMADQLIASQFCLRDEDTLYILKLAYDERHARLAPGNMLLERVIQQGVRDRGFRFVNLVADPPWFKDWKPIATPVHNLYVFNRTPVGQALFVAMSAKRQVKAWYERYRNRGPGLRGAPGWHGVVAAGLQWSQVME